MVVAVVAVLAVVAAFEPENMLKHKIIRASFEITVGCLIERDGLYMSGCTRRTEVLDGGLGLNFWI